MGSDAVDLSRNAQSVTLMVGQQRVLSATGVRSYSEAVRGIVDVRLTKDATEFVLVALKPGSTSLLMLMQDGSERHYVITVTDPNARPDSSAGSDVPARENIRLDFYFVQLDKSFGYQIGVGWPESIAAPTFNATFDFVNGGLQSATAVIANQALPRLDMAQSKGWAKLMRQAAVVAANGEKATFSGGQEVNILVQTSIATGVQRIEAGSTIEVEPRYDAETGRLEVHLHADISELQADRGTGVPGRTKSALDTVVNIELGQAIILGGLTARSERSGKSGLPGLSGIPIFGALFGSHSHAEESMENIAIIVPSVVDATTARDRERIDYALARYLEYSGDLDDVDFLPEAPVKRSP
jgi:pilus assembly protein CpaC